MQLPAQLQCENDGSRTRSKPDRVTLASELMHASSAPKARRPRMQLLRAIQAATRAGVICVGDDCNAHLL